MIIDEFYKISPHSYAYLRIVILNFGGMKKLMTVFIAAIVMVSLYGCLKPYYKTSKGKKKQKYYNNIQYGGKSASQMEKPER